MFRRTLILLSLLLCVLLGREVLAQTTSFQSSPYIFKIHVDDCQFLPEKRTLSGFQVAGLTGIVTALHGVAGCKVINAQSAPGGLGALNGLKIAYVDIDRDMALLWSKELASFPDDGLETIKEPPETDYEDVTIIGYPFGLYRQKPTVAVKIVETTELGDLIPPKIVNELSERDSPAVDIQVLSVQAHLVPGNSGAPLINGDGQVIGVGNGGLDLGRVEMGWAIPWDTIQWKLVLSEAAQEVSWADFRRLQKLASNNPTLFAVEVYEEPQSSVSPIATPTVTVLTQVVTLKICV